jgi:biotin operon repressor
METKDKVLNAIKKAGKPVGAGEIVEATGLDRKDVDKAMNALKKTGEIVSPVRCKWEVAN